MKHDFWIGIFLTTFVTYDISCQSCRLRKSIRILRHRFFSLWSQVRALPSCRASESSRSWTIFEKIPVVVLVTAEYCEVSNCELWIITLWLQSNWCQLLFLDDSKRRGLSWGKPILHSITEGRRDWGAPGRHRLETADQRCKVASGSKVSTEAIDERT